MGPTCAILLKEKISFEQIDEIDTIITNVKNGIVHKRNTFREFVVDSNNLKTMRKCESNCTFCIQFSNKLDEYGDDLVEIEMITEDVIQSKVSISASCNQSDDHIILGTLALRFLEKFDSYIDFGSTINVYRNVSKIKGQLFKIGEEVNYNGFHIADKEFLSNWLKEDNFYMIK